jgi:exopolysaccharide biosynthesis polyprenyl glycosylphosphotransferase
MTHAREMDGVVGPHAGVLRDRSHKTIVSTHSVEHQIEKSTSFNRLARRVCDAALAVAAIVCLAPLLLLVALAIKLDSPGPVIFRQRRVGQNGRPFVIYKFRTMSAVEDGSTIAQARRNDPRVTKVGRLLRPSSIDELPQFLNVLKGEMSLIGPRPLAVAHDDHFGALIPDYALRRRVRPGITGWAQVNGLRGETATIEDMQKRVKMDLWYIDNWSLSLDLRIGWRTCIEVTRRKHIERYGRNGYA